MVVQRSGMMSSENPLTTTTRYYSNPYEAKRQTPSVANDNKNWGDGGKDFYCRTGVESKNNPFTHRSDAATHYNDFHGKKCDEIEEKPQIKAPKFKQYLLQRITNKCI